MATLVVVTPSERLPVTLDEAKDHLRVTADAENALIDALIGAARDWVENFIRRALITRSVRLKLATFCHGLERRTGLIELPWSPVSTVTAFSYVDLDGTSTTVPGSVYEADLEADPAVLRLAYGETWPSHRTHANAVTVEYKAGYGDHPETVPAAIRHALKIYLAHLYEHREPIIAGTIVSSVPDSARSLLLPYRQPLL